MIRKLILAFCCAVLFGCSAKQPPKFHGGLSIDLVNWFQLVEMPLATGTEPPTYEQVLLKMAVLGPVENAPLAVSEEGATLRELTAYDKRVIEELLRNDSLKLMDAPDITALPNEEVSFSIGKAATNRNLQTRKRGTGFTVEPDFAEIILLELKTHQKKGRHFTISSISARVEVSEGNNAITVYESSGSDSEERFPAGIYMLNRRVKVYGDSLQTKDRGSYFVVIRAEPIPYDPQGDTSLTD